MLPRRHTYNETFDKLLTVKGTSMKNTIPCRPVSLKRHTRNHTERNLIQKGDSNEDFDNFERFLKLAKGTFWTKPGYDVNEWSSSHPTLNDNVRTEIKDKNGMDCLFLYNSICIQKKHTKLSGGSRAILKHYLDEEGADFYNWLYFEGINDTLYSILKLYVWCSCLGHGAFAQAHLLKDRETGQLTVIKLQRHDKQTQESTIENIFKEVTILRASQNENIIKMKNYGKTRQRVWIELEYADLGTLETKLTSLTDYMKEKDLFDCWIDLINGLIHLHSLHIIHRDVKCDNIFLFMSSSRTVYKLGDFNLSRLLSTSSDYATSHCGTLSTMAPEIIANEPYGLNVDIWSLLCVVYRMLTFKQCNPISIPTSTLTSRIPSEYGLKHKKIIEFLHKVQPRERPSAQQCKDFFMENNA